MDCRVKPGNDELKLLHRHAGELDHLAPFFGFFGDQLAVFGRRHRYRHAADGSKPREQLRVLEQLVDGPVQDGDDLGRGAPGRGHAWKQGRLTSRHGLGDGGMRARRASAAAR